MNQLIEKLRAKPAIMRVLEALAIAVLGFVLLNLTFISDFLFQSLIIWTFRLPMEMGPESGFNWFPPLMHFVFLLILGIISWFVLNSKLKVIFKAIFLNVPLAAVFVTLGMFLFGWPIVAYICGSLFGLSVFVYLVRTKQPWQYYYVLILISVVMLITNLLGVEI